MVRLACLAKIIAGLEELDAELASRADVPGRLHSQKDTERPAGAGRARYLRAWRTLHSAGDVGVRIEGRARLMTVDAWARHIASEHTERPLSLVETKTASARILDMLGGRAS